MYNVIWIFRRTGWYFLESWLFLAVIMLVAYFGKNMSLIIATGVVMLLKLLPVSNKIFSVLHTEGINWGVIIITISVLVPIATGQIGFSDLIAAFKGPVGWIAIACGILVAVLSRNGVSLLTSSPQVTVALVLGTIIGVVFLKGVAAGPVIAAGITFCLVSLLHLSF